MDENGDPVVDPTKNVIALVHAAVKRLDDLRVAESRRIDEILENRAEYDDRISQAEASRINAIRAVDVNAVAVASQRASDQASVLATQVSQSAEALRGLVATTATAVAQSQSQLATTLSSRITTLEQAQYEGKGKQAYSDPMMAELIVEMKGLRESRAAVVGKSEGLSLGWTILLGLVAFLGVVGTLAGVGLALWKAIH